jgi:hypothetical protein
MKSVWKLVLKRFMAQIAGNCQDKYSGSHPVKNQTAEKPLEIRFCKNHVTEPRYTRKSPRLGFR